MFVVYLFVEMSAPTLKNIFSMIFSQNNHGNHVLLGPKNSPSHNYLLITQIINFRARQVKMKGVGESMKNES